MSKQHIAEDIAKSDSETVVQNIDTFLLDENLAKEDVSECYDKWSSTYEADLSKVKLGYNNPQQLTQALDRHCQVNGDSRLKYEILDVACGTGLLGLNLRQLGFREIDGLDGSSGMLQQARSHEIYRNYYQEIITDAALVSVKAGTYDAVLTTGSFCPNHLTPGCLKHLGNLVKSGGLFGMCMREEFARTHPVLKNIPVEMRRLESEGLWKIELEQVVEHYYGESTGLLYITRIN